MIEKIDQTAADKTKTKEPDVSLLKTKKYSISLPSDSNALKVIRPDYGQLVRARVREVRSGARAADL